MKYAMTITVRHEQYITLLLDVNWRRFIHVGCVVNDLHIYCCNLCPLVTNVQMSSSRVKDVFYDLEYRNRVHNILFGNTLCMQCIV